MIAPIGKTVMSINFKGNIMLFESALNLIVLSYSQDTKDSAKYPYINDLNTDDHISLRFILITSI